MHWSKIREVLAAASDLFAELKNLCVWNKTNAGMGSLYRSKHELIFVFKKGTGPHINNIELGRFGRNRTNVWDYPGQNIFNGTAKSKLSLHPTAKPVALVADAIRDCSHRNGIVLDPFGGVGATLIAAEKTGRKARLIELDPRYVDATIKRWQDAHRRTAVKVDAATPGIQRTPAATGVRRGCDDGCSEAGERGSALMTTTAPRKTARSVTSAPPDHTRFQKGRSGNPRGRQKGVRNFAADVKRSLEIPVTLNEQGKAKRVSTQEALILRLREKALKGDARALETLLALARPSTTTRRASARAASTMAPEDQAILDAFAEEVRSRPASVRRTDAGPRRRGGPTAMDRVLQAILRNGFALLHPQGLCDRLARRSLSS